MVGLDGRLCDRAWTARRPASTWDPARFPRTRPLHGRGGRGVIRSRRTGRRLEAAPTLEGRALFEDLLKRHPDRYDAGQLGTFQRRVKEWRAERAKEMILGRLLKSAVPAVQV